MHKQVCTSRNKFVIFTISAVEREKHCTNEQSLSLPHDPTRFQQLYIREWECELYNEGHGIISSNFQAKQGSGEINILIS